MPVLPHFTRFIIQSIIIGFTVASVLVGVMILLNIANLGTLVANSDTGLFAVSLLIFFMGQTFAGVQIGIAIMLDTKDDNNDKGYRHFKRNYDDSNEQLVPIPVRASRYTTYK